MATLTVSSKLAPFPYSAVCIAYYTKVNVVFNEAATKIALSGTASSDEAEIVQVLAKAGGLSDDSAQVKQSQKTLSLHV